MVSRNSSVTGELLTIAEHIGRNAPDLEECRENTAHQIWQSKTESSQILAIEMDLRPRLYNTAEGQKKFYVASAILKVSEDDGSGISMRVQRNRGGNAKKVNGVDYVGPYILDHFLNNLPLSDGAISIQGLAKIASESQLGEKINKVASRRRRNLF